MAPAFGTIREDYATLWMNMALRPGWSRAFQRDAQRILYNRERYEKVSAVTGVPWFVIGLIHMMESGLDFGTHLHNGDPLTERTIHVPRGRPAKGSPPFAWEESAIDALRSDNVADVAKWCIEQIAYTLEAYNGWGYHYRQIPSPYLWSGTNNYLRGKYVSDGEFNPDAVSEQAGAMAMLSVMRDLDSSIELVFFDESSAALEPQTPVLPAGGAVAEKPKSTLPADALTVVSGVGALAAAAIHTPAATETVPAAPATPTGAAPPPAALPTGQAQSKPAAVAMPAAPPPTKTATGTVQPAQPQPNMIDTYYPFILGGFGVLFLVGLYLSWKRRSGRGYSGQRFSTAVPQLLSRLASGKDITSVPLVRSLRARLLTMTWILVTIVINAIALAELLQYFNLAPSDWYPPFSTLGNAYETLATKGFAGVAGAIHTHFGPDISKWPWLMPFAVIYISMASAFVVANSGLLKRNTSGETLWGAAVHAGWILAIPTFLLDALRYRVVGRFARQNTVLFFGYIAAFAIAYVGARFINDDFLAPYTRQHPQAAATIEQAVEKGLNPVISAADK